MPFTIADGPPGIDATHAWAPGSGSAPPVLNAWDIMAPTWPRIRIEQITGWRSLPDADDNRSPRTSDHGEFIWPGKMLGKTVVYEGEVRTLDWQTLRLPVNQMLQGYSERSLPGVMTVTPFAWIGGPVWTYNARVVSLDFDPKPEYIPGMTEALRWGFSLTMRMHDPYFYSGTDKVL